MSDPVAARLVVPQTIARPETGRHFEDAQVRVEGDTEEEMVVALLGEIDLANTGRIAAHLAELSSEHSLLVVVLDDLDYLDSTGLRALDELTRTRAKFGLAVELVASRSARCRRVFEIAAPGVTLHPTVDAARRARI